MCGPLSEWGLWSWTLYGSPTHVLRRSSESPISGRSCVRTSSPAPPSVIATGVRASRTTELLNSRVMPGSRLDLWVPQECWSGCADATGHPASADGPTELTQAAGPSLCTPEADGPPQRWCSARTRSGHRPSSGRGLGEETSHVSCDKHHTYDKSFLRGASTPTMRESDRP